VNDLDNFPSLRALGQQIDDMAERDTTRPRRSWTPWAVPAARFAAVAAALLAIAGATYAVPTTRAAVDDAYDSLTSWVSGSDSPPPGRKVRADDVLPPWVQSEEGDKRVLAQAGNEKLVAIRRGDQLTLALDDFGESASLDQLRKDLTGRRIVLVGPGRFIPDGRHDRRPLFGVAATTVHRVQFNYADGGPSDSANDLNGAFGLIIDTNRRPSSALVGGHWRFGGR